MESAPSQFLEVQTLLESSLPRHKPNWIWLGPIAAGLTILMAAAFGDSESLAGHGGSLLLLVLAGLIVLLMTMVNLALRRHRREQREVEAAGEWVMLRRWPQAALALEQLLHQPVRSMQHRLQALIYLSSVLTRYHRFDDAIAVHNHLLDTDMLDADTSQAVKAARAVAMLREDHLFDADRAIADLRRLRGASDSAAVSLVEIYRDVKTGHPDEAVEIFESRLPALRDALGIRVADAYALAARAYDLLGRSTDAQDAYAKATRLMSATELARRYPEVAVLGERYAAVTPPTGLNVQNAS